MPRSPERTAPEPRLRPPRNTPTIIESKRCVPVRAETEVLVCGGGLGGIGAATAAARAGAKTMLVERNSFLGGTATAGMCCSMFNCFFTGGQERRLAMTGIPVEVADKLAEAEGYGRKWRQHKGHIIYDLERAKVVFQDLVQGAGVEVWGQRWVADAVMTGRRITGVIVESKSGREAILAKVVVDATGDADIAAFAGVPTRVQHKALHSLCFRLGRVDVDAFVDYFRRHPDQFPEFMDVDWSTEEALAQYEECGTFLFPHGGGIQLDLFQQAKARGDLPARIGVHDTTDACQMHALRRTGVVHVITGFVRFDGLAADMIGRSMTDGRRMAFTLAEVYSKYVPGFENAYVTGTAVNLGVRASRFPDGDFKFTAGMMRAGTHQPDAVGRAVGWDNVVKHHGANAWGAQVCRSDTFDLPLRCLLPGDVSGLVMGAGRSVSSEDPYLLRVMAHTLMVGQAAGTVAAVAVERNQSPHELDPAAVRAELRRQGVAS